MKTMMRTATAAAAMAILLSACGGSPTGSAVQAGATGPSYDGGYIIGTGNRETPPDSTPATGGQTNGQQTTTQGGYIIGTGN